MKDTTVRKNLKTIFLVALFLAETMSISTRMCDPTDKENTSQ
jgi:hypothetical protein